MRELSEQEIDLVAGGPVVAAPSAAPLALIGQCKVLASTAPIMPGLFPAMPGAYVSNDLLTIAE